MTLESKLKEIKKNLQKATTMTNYKGESHPSDSCTDPSVCMAKTDVPMLLEVIEYLIPKDCWCDNELMIQCDECTLRNTITNICRKHYGK